MRFSFTEMFVLKGDPSLDPQKCGEELERLRDKNGGLLKLEDALEASRKKGSSIRRAVEWNDKRAAHKYRSNQIQKLISAIRVKSGNKTVPMYVKCPGKRGGYLYLEEALQHDKTRDKILARAYRDYVSVQTRYQHLQEFAKVNREIEKVRKSRQRKLAIK